MDSILSASETADTAVPGLSVDGNVPVGLCSSPHSRQLVLLIDKRRDLAAQVAGVDVEIAMAVGDREAAIKALDEMKALVSARRAVREAGCFFAERGDADRQQLAGATN